MIVRLVVSFRIDTPDNPEAETALQRLLMHWLARAELARAIEQTLPPGIGCKVTILGTLPSPGRQEKGKECYEYPEIRKPHWWRLR